MSRYCVIGKVCVVLVVQGGCEDMAEAGPPGEIMERRVSPVGTPDPPPARWPLPPHTFIESNFIYTEQSSKTRQEATYTVYNTKIHYITEVKQLYI